MRVVVTGGSGFLGTNLVQHFADAGDDVLNFDILAPRNQRHLGYWHHVDVRDGEALRLSLERFRPTWVIHMAARTDLRGSAISEYSSNIGGVESLLGAVESVDSVERVVFASSMLVCRLGHSPEGDYDYAPSTAYGESKVIGEELVRNRALSRVVWVLVRPTSIWGPWFDEPYRDFFTAVLRRRFVKFGADKTRKTFGYVGNFVWQIEALLRAPPVAVHGLTFYLGDRPALNVETWADQIALEAAVSPPRRVPFGVILSAALLGDALSRFGIPFPMTRFRLKNMTTNNDVDLDRIYELAGPPPFTVLEGIRATSQWIKSQ